MSDSFRMASPAPDGLGVRLEILRKPGQRCPLLYLLLSGGEGDD